MPGRAASATDWKAIRKIANKLEPSLRAAFLAAAEKMQGRVSISALANAIAAGDLKRAQIVIDAAVLADDLQRLVGILNEGFRRGGVVAAAQLVKEIGQSLRFDAVNPEAVRAAERYAARLVTRITKETRDAIRELIVRSIREGIPPYDVAAQLRQMVGMTVSDAQAVMNFREMLIDAGASQDAVRKQVEKLTQRKIRQRGLTIARTEINAALNRGQLELWKQAKRKGLIRATAKKVWIVTPDDRLCPSCAPLDGAEVGLAEGFNGGGHGEVIVPPLHPRCRCAVGLQP